MSASPSTGANETIDGGSVWGTLHRDTNALDGALGAATAALGHAARAAVWLTEDGYPINSPLADILGGLSTVVDGLLDQRIETVEERSRYQGLAGT